MCLFRLNILFYEKSVKYKRSDICTWDHIINKYNNSILLKLLLERLLRTGIIYTVHSNFIKTQMYG